MEVLGAIAVVTAIALALLWYAARGAITVCIAEVHDGKLELTHGAISPRVLADMKDVVRRPRVGRGTVRVVKHREHASVEAKGEFSEAQVQQLRNVVGSMPLAKLLNTTAKKK